MDIKEKNDIFIDNANLQGRMSVFHDKLRKHLSNEYLFLSEKKDNLENEILQLKLEKEQKDKTLFPHIEKRDVRKYFSPLNIFTMPLFGSLLMAASSSFAGSLMFTRRRVKQLSII